MKSRSISGERRAEIAEFDADTGEQKDTCDDDSVYGDHCAPAKYESVDGNGDGVGAKQTMAAQLPPVVRHDTDGGKHWDVCDREIEQAAWLNNPDNCPGKMRRG